MNPYQEAISDLINGFRKRYGMDWDTNHLDAREKAEYERLGALYEDAETGQRYRQDAMAEAYGPSTEWDVQGRL